MSSLVNVISIRSRSVPYDEALATQYDQHEKRRNGHIIDTLLLLEHSPVVTIGRGSHPDTDFLKTYDELKDFGIEVYEADRGGELTYHAPGQLVGYPILQLDDQLGERDLHRYLRNLEQIVIDTIAEFGVSGERRSGLTGVWVGQEKISAIGIKVSRWVTMHGFALNIDCDLKPMREYIVPCGIRDYGVTSLREQGVAATRSEVEDTLLGHFEQILGRQPVVSKV